MSTNIPRSAAAPVLQLEAALPAWCALSATQLSAVTLTVVLFLYCNFLPVGSSATWSEVAWGTIVSNSAAAETGGIQHALPLVRGMRIENIGWVSPWLISQLATRFGPEAISLSFALLQTCEMILWGIVFFSLSRSRWFLFAMMGITCSRFFEIDGLTSAAFGQIGLAALVLLLVTVRESDGQFAWRQANVSQWLAAFATIALWTNLHGSVVIGLALLLVFAIARFCSQVLGEGLFAVWRDREFRSRVWLFEFGLLATLVHPAGIGVWQSALWWPDNPFLFSLSPWTPSSMAGWNGGVVGGSWLMWIYVSRREASISPFFVLASVVATVLVALNESCIVWFAPLMGCLIVDSFERRSLSEKSTTSRATISKPNGSSESTETQRFRFAGTLLAGLVLWLGFCLSPLGSQLLGGQARTDKQVFGSNLPLAAATFLAGDPSSGLTLAPSHWSDFVQSRSGVPMMISDRPELFPETVVHDYQKIAAGRSDWRDVAEQYRLTDLLIDKTQQPVLLKHLRRRPGQWQIVFEDELSVLYRSKS